MLASGIAVIAVSAVCYALMQRAEARGRRPASRAAASGSGDSGSDGSWFFFSSDHGIGSCANDAHGASGDASGAYDAGGGDGGGSGD
jgi:hypothetical protein